MAKNKIIVDKGTIYITIAYIIGINATFLLWKDNFLVAAMLAVLWAICIRYWHTKEDNILFVMGGFAGPILEATAVNLGIWSYTNPNFLGIPLWLPLIWAETLVAAKRVANILLQF